MGCFSENRYKLLPPAPSERERAAGAEGGRKEACVGGVKEMKLSDCASTCAC